MKTIENYLTTSRFAKKAALSPRTIRSYIQKKSIQGVRVIGSNYLIPKSELKRFKKKPKA